MRSTNRAALVLGVLLLARLVSAQQISSDDFNRADGGLGANWTTVSTTTAPTIVSNQVQGAGGDSAAVYVGASWTGAGTNYYSEIQVITIAAGDNGGPLVRSATASETTYQLNIVGQNGTSQTHSIFRIDAGSYAPALCTWTGTVNANDVARLEVSGTGATVTLIAKINGTAQTTSPSPCVDTSGSRITSAGGPGFLISGITGTKFDNWAAGTVSAGGATLTRKTLTGAGQ